MAETCPTYEHEDEEARPPAPDLHRIAELVAELAADLAEEGGGVVAGPDEVVVGRAWAEALVAAVLGGGDA